MYRVLIVEDHEPTRRALRNTLCAEMPDIVITEAASIPSAECAINEGAEGNSPLAAVILDAQLPTAAGIYEMNVSLCPLITRKHIDALVIHCSAFIEDAVMKRHLSEVHERWPSPRGCVISKRGFWDVEVVRTLATDRVQRGLREFFRPDTGLAMNSGRASSTARLSRLICDIERFWKFLPLESQEQIRENFTVSADEGAISVEVGGDA